jgi:hypothetical protein
MLNDGDFILELQATGTSARRLLGGSSGRVGAVGGNLAQKELGAGPASVRSGSQGQRLPAGRGGRWRTDWQNFLGIEFSQPTT